MIALCLGGARSVWTEYAVARDMLAGADHLVIACNFSGVQFAGAIDAWVTLHPDRFAAWRGQRTRRGGNDDYRAFAHDRHDGLESIVQTINGSSGLFMAQTAFEAFDADGAVLCGVPMDGHGGHIHWPGQWTHTSFYQAGFVAAKDAGWPVRSMSGWSADMFGRPDVAWLEQTSARPLNDGVRRRNVKEEAPQVMATVRFNADFDWHPRPGVTIAYLEGMELPVELACARAAKVMGVGDIVEGAS